MTKKERIVELLEVEDLGKTKEELAAMSAADVETLHDDLCASAEEGMKVGDVSPITSKRHDDCVFWLLNGTIVKFKDCSPKSKKAGQSPLFRAKDYCKKTEDGYELIKKDDYVAEEEKKED
jgi:hypothetical protein